MNPWYAKAVILAASSAIVVIRAPHGKRSSAIPIVTNRRGALEVALLIVAWIAFFFPLVWIATPALSFADYPLRPAALAAGASLLATGLWLLWRSHADLGSNWSVSLQLREEHALVTHGLYRRVRHPMYLALLVFSLGEALAIPNWLVGPWCPVAMVLIVAFRVGPEEQMMRDGFGKDYEEYAAASWHLVPRVW